MLSADQRHFLSLGSILGLTVARHFLKPRGISSATE
jgi:hypothetical protein